jgi:hypothetical protein
LQGSFRKVTGVEGHLKGGGAGRGADLEVQGDVLYVVERHTGAMRRDRGMVHWFRSRLEVAGRNAGLEDQARVVFRDARPSSRTVRVR